MFRVGETYLTPNGSSVLIVANDTPHRPGVIACPIIGIVTAKGAKVTQLYSYSKEGWYCGMDPKINNSYIPYNIQSEEPNEEELKIIADLREVIRDGAEDDVALTKLLRQLRK